MQKPTQRASAGTKLCILAFLSGFLLAYILFSRPRTLPVEDSEAHDGCEKQLVQFKACIDETVAAARTAGKMTVDVRHCQEHFGGSLQQCINEWQTTKVRWNQGSQSRITYTRYGPILFNVNDMYVGRSLKVYGEWSGLEASEVYAAEIRTGDVVLDVGANIGSMAMIFSHLVGPAGLGSIFLKKRKNMTLTVLF
jgi:hypothetical protein